MPESGASLDSGQLIVEKGGTAVPLPTLPPADGAARSVMIQALFTNEGKIVVGGSAVVAKQGTHAKPEQKGIALNPGDTIAIDIVDTAKIWIDATINGDGIGYIPLIA